MKYHRFTIAVLLCVCLLCLYGCGSNTPMESEPAKTEPSTAPTETTAPAPVPEDVYNAARIPLDNAKNLSLTVSHKTSRTVGGETYTAARVASATYTGFGTDDMAAFSEEKLTYGTYETEVTELYADRTAYRTIRGTTFSSAVTPEEYAARELPAVLLDAAKYATITMKEGADTTVLTFTGATALESWVTGSVQAELVSASGTATLNASGVLTQTTYIADYTDGNLTYRVEATVTVSIPESPDLSSKSIPETSIAVSCYDAPRMLLQAVGDIFTARSISSSSQEMLVCNAAALVRTNQTVIDLFGTGSSFLANADYTVSLTDYTGNTVTSTQVETFRDGSYSCSVDGGTPVTQAGITAALMRTGCEDILLSSLFIPEQILSAELTDTGDFYCIRFTGNDAFITALSDWIYTLIGVDLDDYASSASTAQASGYLVIDKNTGLPTSLGQVLKRTHIIENVSYDLVYEFNQSLNLSSATSYKAVTGTLAPEEKPETEATPLFYKVTGTNGQTMWLLGTIHVGDERTAYLPQTIYDALRASDALAVEMDVTAFEDRLEADAALQQQAAAGYYYTDGSTVSDHLDADLYRAAKDLMLATGNYSSTAERMKAALWENSINNFLLQQSYGLIADKGVDQRLITMAKAANQPVWDIEDPISHALLTTTYSDALQAYLLKSTLETSLAEYSRDVAQLYELWCQGDKEALTHAVKDDLSGFTQEELALYSEYYKAMITDRNAVMLQKAQQYLESGDTVFFAVGLAHVLGEDGLAEALRTAGYTVEAVTYH